MLTRSRSRLSAPRERPGSLSSTVTRHRLTQPRGARNEHAFYSVFWWSARASLHTRRTDKWLDHYDPLSLRTPSRRLTRLWTRFGANCSLTACSRRQLPEHVRREQE